LKISVSDTKDTLEWWQYRRGTVASGPKLSIINDLLMTNTTNLAALEQSKYYPVYAT
jgi:hypothetical protein